MRRLFIVRKDLNMSSGKVSAQIAHCAELYWLNLIKENLGKKENNYNSTLILENEIVEEYIVNAIVKTVLQAKNLNHLLKAKTIAEELGLKEYRDFGFVNDKCLTELKPENENGTTTTCFWTKPLPDEIAHMISKKYHLYIDKKIKIPSHAADIKDLRYSAGWNGCIEKVKELNNI